MGDRRALIGAVIANPDEDTPRLALAGRLLDEHGDEHDRARAAFVRRQIDFARRHGPALQPEPDPLHKAEWLRPLAPLVGKVITHPPADVAGSRGLLKYLLFQTGEFLQKAFQKVAPDALAAVEGAFRERFGDAEIRYAPEEDLGLPDRRVLTG